MSEEIRPMETIASMGGKAAAANMTATERKERAKKAAEARWHADVPQATHEGVVKIGNTEIFAAVLAGGKRLISQATFLRAIGRARSPKAGTGVLTTVDDLPFFLQAAVLKPFINDDLRKSTRPLFFLEMGGKKSVGYDAELLPAVAEVYLKMRDDYTNRKVLISDRYLKIITACDILMRGLARVGIVALVDEATGYQKVRGDKELEEILSKYISKELARWVHTFQQEYYDEMYRLREWTHLDPRSPKKPTAVAKYTINLVYDRIHPSLEKELKKTRSEWEDGGGKKWGKLHQFTSRDIGHPRLTAHLEGVMMVMKFAKNWKEFMYRMDVAYPKLNQTLRIPFPESEDETA